MLWWWWGGHAKLTSGKGKENWKYRCMLLSLTKSTIISEEKDTQSIRSNRAQIFPGEERYKTCEK